MPCVRVFHLFVVVLQSFRRFPYHNVLYTGTWCNSYPTASAHPVSVCPDSSSNTEILKLCGLSLTHTAIIILIVLLLLFTTTYQVLDILDRENCSFSQTHQTNQTKRQRTGHPTTLTILLILIIARKQEKGGSVPSP